MAAVPVGRCDEARGRKLRVETVFGDQHQVRKTAYYNTGADVLQTDRWTYRWTVRQVESETGSTVKFVKSLFQTDVVTLY